MTNKQAYVVLENCASLLDSGTRFFTEDHVKQFHEAYELAMMALRKTERKTGSWNVIQGDIVVCSECGMCAPKSMTGCLLNRHLEPNRTNFCPNCGADMRGKQNGQ